MNESSGQQRVPRVQWFVGRGNNIFVPLVPLDEMPDGVELSNLPRQMTYGQVNACGGQFLGIFTSDGFQHALENVQNMPHLGGLGPGQRPQSVGGSYRIPHPQQPYYMGDLGGAPMNTDSGVTGARPTQPIRHHQRMSSEAQPYYPSPSHQVSPDPTSGSQQPSSAQFGFLVRGEGPSGQPAINEPRSVPPTTPGSFVTASYDNNAQASSTHAHAGEPHNLTATAPEYTPATSNRPTRPNSSAAASSGTQGQKVYCSFWIRTGTCDYLQQGCKYRHEMPKDPQQLQEITGLTDTPKWYQNAQEAGVTDPTGRLAPHQPLYGRRDGRGGAGALRSPRRGGRAGKSWRKSPQQANSRPAGTMGSGLGGGNGWGGEQGSPKQHSPRNRQAPPHGGRNNNGNDEASVTSGRDWSPVGRRAQRTRAWQAQRLRVHSQSHGPSNAETQSAPIRDEQNTTPWGEPGPQRSVSGGDEPHQPATDNTTPWGESGPERAATQGDDFNQPATDSTIPWVETGAKRAAAQDNKPKKTPAKIQNRESPSSGSNGGLSLVDDQIGEEALSSYPCLPPQPPSPPDSMKVAPPSEDLVGSSKKSPWEGITHINGALIPPSPKYIYHFVKKAPEEGKGDSEAA
ncbi:MAG: hypothetical protein M1831_004039 [Alyxoria varia]|nr:MAG: hypothetical protein M1831_004039 [Alyxoria varia]